MHRYKLLIIILLISTTVTPIIFIIYNILVCQDIKLYTYTILVEIFVFISKLITSIIVFKFRLRDADFEKWIFSLFPLVIFAFFAIYLNLYVLVPYIAIVAFDILVNNIILSHIK